MQESDYDKLPVSEITLENFAKERQETCEHIGKPLNELETRCCARKGQRVMNLTIVMRKIQFRCKDLYITYRAYSAYEERMQEE